MNREDGKERGREKRGAGDDSLKGFPSVAPEAGEGSLCCSPFRLEGVL
jgi:hypothetical protein